MSQQQPTEEEQRAARAKFEAKYRPLSDEEIGWINNIAELKHDMDRKDKEMILATQQGAFIQKKYDKWFRSHGGHLAEVVNNIAARRKKLQLAENYLNKGFELLREAESNTSTWKRNVAWLARLSPQTVEKLGDGTASKNQRVANAKMVAEVNAKLDEEQKRRFMNWWERWIYKSLSSPRRLLKTGAKTAVVGFLILLQLRTSFVQKSFNWMVDFINNGEQTEQVDPPRNDNQKKLPPAVENTETTTINHDPDGTKADPLANYEEPPMREGFNLVSVSYFDFLNKEEPPYYALAEYVTQDGTQMYVEVTGQGNKIFQSDVLEGEFYTVSRIPDSKHFTPANIDFNGNGKEDDYFAKSGKLSAKYRNHALPLGTTGRYRVVYSEPSGKAPKIEVERSNDFRQ